MLVLSYNTLIGGFKNRMENLILFDWLSFTSPFHSVESIIDFLGLNKDKIVFRTVPGSKTYSTRLTFGNIHISYGSEINPGVWVEMTGQGCREFEQYSSKTFIDLFTEFCDNPKDYHISRLDVAYDDFNKKLDIYKLKKETENLNFVSKFKDPVIEFAVRSKAITIYLGSLQSDIFMRVYDKAKERKRDDIPHWVRWEIVLKNDNAFNFLSKLLLNDEVIGNIFFGLVNNYVRYIIPDANETNISRLKTAKWWLKWLESFELISVYSSKPTSYNLSRCEAYGFRQAGNAVSTLIDIKGVTNFLKELRQFKPKTNIKYQSLIDTNGKSEEDILSFLAERGAL